MNRIYKVIWSNVKNCYIVTSEIAKNYSKATKQSSMGRVLTLGVLLSLFSFGIVIPNIAQAYTYSGKTATVTSIPVDCDATSIINSSNITVKSNLNLDGSQTISSFTVKFPQTLKEVDT